MYNGNPLCRGCVKKAWRPGDRVFLKDGTSLVFTPPCNVVGCPGDGRHDYGFFIGRGKKISEWLCDQCDAAVRRGETAHLESGTIIGPPARKVDVGETIA